MLSSALMHRDPTGAQDPLLGGKRDKAGRSRGVDLAELACAALSQYESTGSFKHTGSLRRLERPSPDGLRQGPAPAGPGPAGRPGPTSSALCGTILCGGTGSPSESTDGTGSFSRI